MHCVLLENAYFGLCIDDCWFSCVLGSLCSYLPLWSLAQNTHTCPHNYVMFFVSIYVIMILLSRLSTYCYLSVSPARVNLMKMWFKIFFLKLVFCFSAMSFLTLHSTDSTGTCCFSCPQFQRELHARYFDTILGWNR